MRARLDLNRGMITKKDGLVRHEKMINMVDLTPHAVRHEGKNLANRDDPKLLFGPIQIGTGATKSKYVLRHEVLVYCCERVIAHDIIKIQRS